eukprot:CAMPEP_0203671074 /NCGR_PEP_ID=MMETSP0090-20130426/6979_1 /ASSEMBLY_ACC=CAM_ASM_001088 /TAXON_ID=426623 /ORGANISM="Chaetoceros affinis, Strain CCMP159" /LENGTH=427 /DNA_ID=CAMNT_0050536083 /DNA_START=47 /DNA_END=1330 /DNA_ORIENTATION=-
MSALPACGLGLLTIIGGVVGFVKKGSTASLVFGVVCGLLLFGGGLLVSKRKNVAGHALASTTSGALAFAMGKRYLITGKMMPSGMIAILSFLTLVHHFKKTLESKLTTTSAGTTISSLRWWQGFFLSSIFSVVYLLTPVYNISAVVLLCMQYPTRRYAIAYAAPFLLSVIIPSTEMCFLAKYMTSMLDYFGYEEILEISNEETLKRVNSGQNYILAMQPHGVVSFCSLCSWVNTEPEFRRIKTGVASVLLKFPILKHVMGIYGLTPASGSNVKKILNRKDGIDGSIVLYIGGIAELFKSSRKEERLYLKKRKGFIKIALREGSDVIPVYLFGNTSVLTVLKTSFLAALSRKPQMSLTYFWGKWMLPIPRDEKLLYVRGRPLNLPHIPEPTNEDVDKWHAKYCDEVKRIFDSYKEKVPAYKHKTLYFD